jgi:hypothetical protein
MNKEKKLSIIIPYRDRAEHLEEFMNNAISKINVDNFDILIVEQFNTTPFNKGFLLNVGFLIKESNSDYFVFHDVDMMPIEIDYSYCEKPTHCVSSIIEAPLENYLNYPKKYKSPTKANFGGVCMFNKEDYRKVNGFSIEFWGWGGEDNDILNRVKKCNYPLSRRKGIYYNFIHKRPNKNTENYKNNIKKLSNNYDFKLEGLNTTNFKIIEETSIKNNIVHLKVDFK